MTHPAEALIAALIRGDVIASYSALTVFELWRGRLDIQEELKYQSVMTLMEEASLTGPAARLAGAWLRRLTFRLSEALVRDALIAATAAERGETIYTRNVADFQRFYPDVKSY